MTDQSLTSEPAPVDSGVHASESVAAPPTQRWSPDFPASRSEPAIKLPEQAPVPWREPLAVVLLVAAFDWLIYRSHGFSGPAAWLLLAPLLLTLGVPRFRPRGSVWLLGALLALLAARQFWQGSLAGVLMGVALLAALSLSLLGTRPYVISVAVHLFQVVIAGPLGAVHYLTSLMTQKREEKSSSSKLTVLMPLIAVALFGTIFIMANPDLVRGIREFVREYGEWLTASLENLIPQPEEVTLWVIVGLISIGLLRPVTADLLTESTRKKSKFPAAEPAETSLYPASRNTLIALIVLFAGYLIFEFQTLWFREFPEGFYYAGYAHEGAAWLTVALALATLVLSVIFRGEVLRDWRLARLRTWAWIWSGLNLVLAAAVYNRMFIYIDFNGMTRMRTIGLLGISCVVVGFILVIAKIVRQRSFLWLVHRQLWTLAFFVYLYLLLPVDVLIHQYNVRQVLAGNLAPVVQVTEHPVSSEGVMMLTPLLESEDPIIREGIRAMLAERFAELNAVAAIRHEQDWTAYQHADQLLLNHLDRLRPQWQDYAEKSVRETTLERFREYAYQWY
jgi:hypothetical protein